MVTKFSKQVRSSRGIDPNETNQAGAVYVFMLRLCDTLKTYLHYRSVYGRQAWQNDNLP